MHKKHRNSIIFEFNSFDITKQELLSSIIILMLILVGGGLISQKISTSISDRNAIYNKAAQIESSDLFDYGMRTDVGNAFVYGDMQAVDPVSYPGEIDGQYLYLEKVKERYTMHTRVVTRTRTVNGRPQTYTTTETYWSWDRVDSWEKQATQVTFLDVLFDADKFSLPEAKHIQTNQESSHIRYKYYGIAEEITGTIFTTLREGTIQGGPKFYKDLTIDKTLDKLTQSEVGLWVFRIVWLIVSAGIIFGFYYIDNRWLE